MADAPIFRHFLKFKKKVENHTKFLAPHTGLYDFSKLGFYYFKVCTTNFENYTLHELG
jgi:hypothetical protein